MFAMFTVFVVFRLIGVLRLFMRVLGGRIVWIVWSVWKGLRFLSVRIVLSVWW